MRFAPVGVRRSGWCHHHHARPGDAGCFGKFMLSFYLALAALWLVLVFAGLCGAGRDVFFACYRSSARPC